MDKALQEMTLKEFVKALQQNRVAIVPEDSECGECPLMCGDCGTCYRYGYRPGTRESCMADIKGEANGEQTEVNSQEQDELKRLEKAVEKIIAVLNGEKIRGH